MTGIKRGFYREQIKTGCVFDEKSLKQGEKKAYGHQIRYFVKMLAHNYYSGPQIRYLMKTNQK